MIVITELELPQMDVGAPEPHLYMNADEELVLAYYARVEPDEVKPFGVTFAGVSSYRYGYPNDEGLHSHPLYKDGLGHYAVYEVGDSPWIKELTNMKAVTWGKDYLDSRPPSRHLVWTFKEGTFEVACWGFNHLSFKDAARACTAMSKLDQTVFPDPDLQRDRVRRFIDQEPNGRWVDTFPKRTWQPRP